MLFCCDVCSSVLMRWLVLLRVVVLLVGGLDCFWCVFLVWVLVMFLFWVICLVLFLLWVMNCSDLRFFCIVWLVLFKVIDVFFLLGWMLFLLIEKVGCGFLEISVRVRVLLIWVLLGSIMCVVVLVMCIRKVLLLKLERMWFDICWLIVIWVSWLKVFCWVLVIEMMVVVVLIGLMGWMVLVILVCGNMVNYLCCRY